MASSTTNYNLIKPDYEDSADIKDLNDNFDTIDTAMNNKVDKEIGKGLSTNDYTTAEKTKLAGIAEGAEVNVQSNWAQTTTTADDYIKNKPTLGTAAAKNATDTYNATGNDVTTGKAVAAALATLPEPMVFKGSLGTGGTITTLPTASSSNKGYVYKVITAGTYASQSAKVGDTFISDGSAWVLIPSGDEPSGTVTNVAVANGGGLTVSGSPITTSGTITVGHSNSVTAKTSSSVKKFTYDANGHVTGSSELSTAESNALASGIDSTKVAQIETNKNNISSILTEITPIAFQTVSPTPSNYISINGGGYARIGNICIVQIRAKWLRSCMEGEAIIQGLPKPLLNYDVYTAGASVVNNLHKNMSVMGNGTIAWVDGDSPSSGGLVLSAVYICKD